MLSSTTFAHDLPCVPSGLRRKSDTIRFPIEFETARESPLGTPAHTQTERRGSRLYVAMAVIAAALVFAGFARTFYLNLYFAKLNLSGLRIIHGIVFSCWLILFVVQTSLVSAKRVDLHRKFGVFGAVLATLMVILGTAMGINAAKYGTTNPGLPPPTVFLVVPIFDMVVFAILFASAFYYRRKPDMHKRLMLVATISILPAAIARILFLFGVQSVLVPAFVLADVLLLGCILYDSVISRRLHRAWLWGGLLVILSFPLRLMIAPTAAWQSFAHWLIR
jgi:hypothetical protein